MLNGDAHYSTLEDEPRIDRCLFSKDDTMCMITECEPSHHLLALYSRLSALPYRMLYVGLDHELMYYLQDTLQDCWTVRAPAACVARPFIRELWYSVPLFDDLLMDTTARELARYTRALPQKLLTPILIVSKSDNYELLARTVRRLLSTH